MMNASLISIGLNMSIRFKIRGDIMASYSQIQIVFSSYKPKLIGDLWSKISNFMRLSVNRGVYEFLLEEGYSPKKAASLNFVRCDKYVVLNKNLAYLKIETESAWEAETNVFYEYICDKYNGKIEMVYLAQEQDRKIFINTDATSFYFWQRYKINHFNLENGDCITKYFRDWDSLCQYVQSVFPKVDMADIYDVDDIETKIWDKYSKEDEEFYCDIHKFVCP